MGLIDYPSTPRDETIVDDYHGQKVPTLRSWRKGKKGRRREKGNIKRKRRKKEKKGTKREKGEKRKMLRDLKFS